MTIGTEHFIRLKVTTLDEVQAYREQIGLQKLQSSKKGTPAKAIYNRPFTRVEIIDQNPVQCLIQAEGRRGHCKLVIRGKIPDELRMYASEVYQDPDEENNTWVANRPRTILFHMKDTKAAQV